MSCLIKRRLIDWLIHIDKHVVFASLFHAKLPPVVTVRSLLPRSRLGLNILCRQWLYCTHGNTILILWASNIIRTVYKIVRGRLHRLCIELWDSFDACGHSVVYQVVGFGRGNGRYSGRQWRVHACLSKN